MRRTRRGSLKPNLIYPARQVQKRLPRPSAKPSNALKRIINVTTGRLSKRAGEGSSPKPSVQDAGVGCIRDGSCCEPRAPGGLYALETMSPHIVDWATHRLMKEIDGKCEPRIPHAPLVPVKWANADQLSKKLSPKRSVGITYDSCAITKAGRNLDPGSSHCSHASVVIASKRNDAGVCEYKIRNSWGTDCGAYKASIRERCQDGAFWISAAELKPMIQEVIALE